MDFASKQAIKKLTDQMWEMFYPLTDEQRQLDQFMAAKVRIHEVLAGKAEEK